jgi:hypothetical protein
LRGGAGGRDGASLGDRFDEKTVLRCSGVFKLQKYNNWVVTPGNARFGFSLARFLSAVFLPVVQVNHLKSYKYDLFHMHFGELENRRDTRPKCTIVAPCRRQASRFVDVHFWRFSFSIFC